MLSNTNCSFDMNSVEIKLLCQNDDNLAKIINIIGPIEYSLHKDPYVFLINIIIGQMLSNKVAHTMQLRFRNICHDNVCPEVVASLTYDEIHSIGLS